MLGAAAGALVALYALYRVLARRGTQQVVLEDEEMIEAELAELDKLVGGLAGMEASAPPESPAPAPSEARAISPARGAEGLKSELRRAAAAPKDRPVVELPAQKGYADWSPTDMQQYLGMRGLIGKARVLLQKKESKKTYVLYVKIRRSYERLPKKIQMRISEEYNGILHGIRRSIPELEIVDVPGMVEKTEDEKERVLRALLGRAEDAISRGEKVKAFVLYSEVKGMYHLAPERIKKEVYQRCVAIYRRCVTKG